jgi:dienelactone hydrolase
MLSRSLFRVSILSVGIWYLFLGIGYAHMVARPVEYKVNGVKLEGFMVYDFNVKGKRPGVLVVHEWWGHNEYARKRAQMLAELGYTAFALDMYGQGKLAKHPEDAAKFSSEVRANMKEASARFEAALSLLKNHRTVDSTNISAIGYCFGGGIVLEMARRGLTLNAAVSFHGNLDTKERAKPGMVKARVLVCHGANDTFVTPDQIKDFKVEMDNALVDYQFKTYPNALHSFTNPHANELAVEFNLPLEYSFEADEQSWQDMQAFLSDSIIKNQPKEKKLRQKEEAPGKQSDVITGTIRYIESEGGFFGIITDDFQNLEPMNLDANLREDGLRIQFRVIENSGSASFRMWGTLVKIVDVVTLEITQSEKDKYLEGLIKALG